MTKEIWRETMGEFCRCLQGAASICEEQHGRKHKGACVTTLATGWQSWHHSQQHGAWRWYHTGYLRGWSNSAKIIISKKEWFGRHQIWITSATFHFNHIFIHTAATDCLSECPPALWTYCFSANAICSPLLFLEVRCKNSLWTSTICFGGSQISLHNPAYQ